MMRMSVPASSRWVAKLCRSVWTVTGLAKPAARTATRQAACSVAVLTGRPASRPGNSQCAGLARRQ